MAHSLFEGFGVAGLDGQQTALAVQSLLDSQTSTEIAQDDGDIFQCGRCKRQYTSLTEFMAHKEKCSIPAAPKAIRHTVVPPAAIGGGQTSAFTATLPHLLNKQNLSLAGGATIYGGPLGQSLVLSEEEFTALASIDNPNLNLQAQQINITFQGGNPVLSQISSSPLTPHHYSVVSTSPTLTGAVTSLASANSAFTSTVPTSSLEQEIEISDVVVTEESVSDEPLPPNSIADPALTVQVPLPGPSASQSSPTTAASSSLAASQPQATIIDGSSLEGLTLQTLTPGGGLQFQQIQLAGPQAQPIVLAQGLPASQANLIQGISIVKPSPTKPTSTKKDGYAILQTELQYLTPSQSEVQAAGQKQKGRVKTEKTAAVVTEEGGKKKLRCTYCDKPFSKNFDLQQHVRSHTGEKPFQCIVCGRAFAQKSNVKKHMQTHKVWPKAATTLPEDPIILLQGQEKPAVEPTEKAVAVSSPEKNVSMMIDSSYNCQYCAQKFTNYFRLKSHMVMHKSEQVYKCIHEKCSCTFKDLDAYLEHTKTHENEMEYNCHICNKKFPALYDLGVHQYSHSLYPNQGSKPGPKYYKCALCGNKYTSTTALKHHLDSTDHKFPCPQCQKTFQCERALRRHITTHNESLEFVCEVCQKGFKTQQYLKLHMLNHQTETPWACNICGVAFNRKDKLTRHRIIHEPNKKYKCPFRNHTGCDKAFNRADKLKAHIISHSGIKPFKCRYCSKTFSRRPHLNEHIRVHEGNYRFHCPKCKKGFNRKNLFRIHTCRSVIKEGDKPETEAETINRLVRKPIYNKKMKRKPGRPRKVVFMDAAEALDKVKRPVGRPKKPILPYPDKDPMSISASVISSQVSSTQSVSGESSSQAVKPAAEGLPVLTQQLAIPLDTFEGEIGEDGENVVHVQLVTDQQGPMLAQDLEQQQHHSETTLKLESASQQPQQQQPGINFVGALTQEHLQEIFLNGNTHNVKLMETENGETFVIDEATQQILAQINTSPQQEEDTGEEVAAESVELYPETPTIVLSSEGNDDISPVVSVVATEVITTVAEDCAEKFVDDGNLTGYEVPDEYSESLEEVYKKNQDLCKKENIENN